MSALEIRTRVGQEFTKRADLAMYRAGVDTVRNSVGPSSRQRDFFFSKAEIQSRTKVLRQHLPEVADAIVREAGEVCQHRFRLLGYEPLDYGQTIDWHLDAVHGKRAPLVPWYTIRFLDFSAVGDHKVTWELNRHQHFVTLAKAWCLTHDDRYVKELVAQWYDWERANPYPLGINWGSSLEVAFRSLSWLWAKFLLADCPALPAAFEKDLLRGLARNGLYIENFLSTYFSPNTHLIGEAVALFFIGTLCPEIRLAPRWKRDGWRILEEELGRQVRPDGVYFEQALHYHVYALDFFLHTRLLAEKNRFDIPAEYDRVVNRMIDVVVALSQGGTPQTFGDDDGGRLFDPRRNQSEHLTDPLALGALIYGREDARRSAQLTEEAIWLFGENALALVNQTTPASRRSTAFQNGGIYVMADPIEPALMMIDAGPQGTGHCGHGHADALNVLFTSGDRSWLIDPGTYVYISDTDGREIFRSTAAHNTVRVDQQDQAVPEGPFAWSAIPRVVAEQWIQGQTFDFFVGSHNGYTRLPDPVGHRRFVFHAHGAPWVIRDVVEGSQIHEVEASWHFAPDLLVTSAKGGFRATVDPSTNHHTPGTAPSLNLSWASRSTLNGFIESGYVSPSYGARKTAPVVRLRIQNKLPVEFATVLIPSETRANSESDFRLLSKESDSVQAYSYSSGDVTDLFYFSLAGKPWTFNSWESDATFLYCRQSKGRVVHLVLVNGSSVNHGSKSLIHHSHSIERFEWLKKGDASVTYCSHHTPVEHALDREPELDSVS